MNLPKRLFVAARALALRLVANQQVRRVVMPLAGLVTRVRTRGMSVQERWNHSIGWEVSFWDDWLRTPEAARRLDPANPLDGPPTMLRVIEQLGTEHVRIVDVGAGPITPIGRVLDGHTIEVTATDALAAEYDEVLARAGIVPPVRTIFAHAERLSETVPHDFDVAYCANALDHMYDPARAVESMLAVVRPGGYVVLNHFANEGEIQHYTGLHQWNIDERGGDFVLWGKDSSENMTQRLADKATVECTRFPDPRGSRLEIAIRKHDAA
jgi:SAM-dependent methyltransferase